MSTTFSEGMKAEVAGAFSFAIPAYEQRNKFLKGLWTPFYRGEGNTVRVRLYDVDHMGGTGVNPAGGAPEGSACLLSNVTLTIGIEYPVIANSIQRHSEFAMCRCTEPSTGTDIKFENIKFEDIKKLEDIKLEDIKELEDGSEKPALVFYQNKLGIEELAGGEWTHSALILDPFVADVKKILGLVCGWKVFSQLPNAVKDEFDYSCPSELDPGEEFANIFQYEAYMQEDKTEEYQMSQERLWHRKVLREMNPHDETKMDERERIVNGYIRNNLI